jgi:aspartyl-tRNA(Asn)/glutamyl-tRNA(Gln) amidotransferase subunit C
MLTTEETARIATLAHLDLPAADIERLTRELSKILEYIDQLAAAPIGEDEADPDTSPTPLRSDQVMPSLPLSDVERNAPLFGDGFFLVPKVIGGGES